MNIQQIRAQIAALQDATMDENKNFRTAYDEGKFDALSAVDALLDSMQEEPANRIPVDIKAAMQELEEKSNAFTEAHQGESFYEILAWMRGEEPVSNDLEDQG